MTSEQKRLERHRRYNSSAKGQARNKRYEQAHPERGQRIRVGVIARDGQRAQSAKISQETSQKD